MGGQHHAYLEFIPIVASTARRAQEPLRAPCVQRARLLVEPRGARRHRAYLQGLGMHVAVQPAGKRWGAPVLTSRVDI
jgi:hypothetical protein